MTDIFTPKPFSEIVAGMVERLRVSTDRVTDFNTGSVARSLLEAGAIELDDYYQEVYTGLLRAIPTAVYQGFGFAIKPAVAAAGVAQFIRGGDTSAALDIPVGTRLQSLSGCYYVTDAILTLAIGHTQGAVTITAETVGTVGNADPGALAIVAGQAGAGVLSAANPAILSGGEDAETDEQRASRFAAYILSLSRGTLAALEYAATLPALYHPVTGILSERAQRVGTAEAPGYVALYIHNGSHGASEALLAAVQQIVDGYRDGASDTWVGGYRPAGMRVQVLAMADLAFDVDLELTATIGAVTATVEAAVSGALGRWLRARVPGDRVRPIDLVNAALGVDGVSAATILAPTTTITVAPSSIAYLRAATVTWTA